MHSNIIYRRGNLQDLSDFTFASRMPTTAQSIEFNVIGMGHEFWIAIEGSAIVGLTVIGKANPDKITIMYLQVPETHTSRGIGTSLVKKLVESYKGREFSVIPFEGTEDFYRRLGFERISKEEMALSPTRNQDS
jgi:N-acetylglutamate synthase-like GNAT family acetyltransferase